MMVRLADRIVVTQLLRLLDKMRAEAPYLRDIPLNEELARAALLDMAEAGAAIIAQDADGTVAGFLLLSWGIEWWSGRLLVSERALYIGPAYRGRMLASRLVAAGVARARAIGAAEFRAGTSVGTDEEATCVVYARAGFEDGGRTFRLRLGVEAPTATTLGSPQQA